MTNLLDLWCVATDSTLEQALSHFDHNMYGKLKVETAEAVIAQSKDLALQALLVDPVVDKVSAHDFHATLMTLLGFDHKRLTYPFQGLDQRLTGVEDTKVVRDILG